VAFLAAFQAVIYQDRRIFFLFFMLFPLPQIIQNFAINKRMKWNWWYFGALVAPKILYMVELSYFLRNINCYLYSFIQKFTLSISLEILLILLDAL